MNADAPTPNVITPLKRPITVNMPTQYYSKSGAIAARPPQPQASPMQEIQKLVETDVAKHWMEYLSIPNREVEFIPLLQWEHSGQSRTLALTSKGVSVLELDQISAHSKDIGLTPKTLESHPPFDFGELYAEVANQTRLSLMHIYGADKMEIVVARKSLDDLLPYLQEEITTLRARQNQINEILKITEGKDQPIKELVGTMVAFLQAGPECVYSRLFVSPQWPIGFCEYFDSLCVTNKGLVCQRVDCSEEALRNNNYTLSEAQEIKIKNIVKATKHGIIGLAVRNMIIGAAENIVADFSFSGSAPMPESVRKIQEVLKKYGGG